MPGSCGRTGTATGPSASRPMPAERPLVHRVNGRHPDSHYLTHEGEAAEVAGSFDFSQSVYLIVSDNSSNLVGAGSARGVGGRKGRNSGSAVVSADFDWVLAAHELGHAFGLPHDFRDDSYLMSYGRKRNRLSACAAGFLAVNPYFVPGAPAEETTAPTVELLSRPEYPAGSKSVPVRLEVQDAEGLQQVSLFVTTREPHSSAGFFEVKSCRRLSGKRAVAEFDFDGVVPSAPNSGLSDSAAHNVRVSAVDANGNRAWKALSLREISREPDRHSPGTLGLGQLPGLYPGWKDPRHRVEGPHRHAVGPGDAGAHRYPGVERLLGEVGVLAGRDDAGLGILHLDQAVGARDREKHRHPVRAWDEGQFPGVFTRRGDAGLGVLHLDQAVGPGDANQHLLLEGTQRPVRIHGAFPRRRHPGRRIGRRHPPAVGREDGTPFRCLRGAFGPGELAGLLTGLPVSRLRGLCNGQVVGGRDRKEHRHPVRAWDEGQFPGVFTRRGHHRLGDGSHDPAVGHRHR